MAGFIMRREASESGCDDHAVQGQAGVAMNIGELWTTPDELAWNQALAEYWNVVRNCDLEREFETLTTVWFRELSPEQWRDFIFDKYLSWKHTDGRIRSHAQSHFAKNSLDDIRRIKKTLFRSDLSNARRAIGLISELRGIGPSGATGLLAVMFPGEFGTADKFVVESLRHVPNLLEARRLSEMKADNLDLEDTTLIVSLLRRRATLNNEWFGNENWTPRKIDKICWSLRH